MIFSNKMLFKLCNFTGKDETCLSSKASMLFIEKISWSWDWLQIIKITIVNSQTPNRCMEINDHFIYFSWMLEVFHIFHAVLVLIHVPSALFCFSALTWWVNIGMLAKIQMLIFTSRLMHCSYNISSTWRSGLWFNILLH